MKRLQGLPIYFQNINPYPNKFDYHLFLIVIDKRKTNKRRDDLITYLNKNKIGTGVNYRSVTDMSLYRKNLDWNDSTCKISKNLGDNILSLPLYPSLKISQAKYICDKVSEFFKN